MANGEVAATPMNTSLEEQEIWNRVFTGSALRTNGTSALGGSGINDYSAQEILNKVVKLSGPGGALLVTS